MGYIFDALNKAGDDPSPNKGRDNAPTLPPGGLRLNGDDDATPAVESAAPTTHASAQPDPALNLSQLVDAAQQQAPTQTPDTTQTHTTENQTVSISQVNEVVEHSAPVAAGVSKSSAGSDAVERTVDERLVGLTDPASVMAEEYRSIRTGILARNRQRRHLIHTITSATPREGKTITSLNLGLIFSELHNRRTIVIEADLRLPQFAKLLDLGETPGVVNVIQDGVDLADAIISVGDNNLHILPAGESVADKAVSILTSGTMASILRTLKQTYDHVIIDTPPVVELADAGILGAMSDEVLLVARMNQTPRPLVEQAIRTLASYDAPAAGLIATDQKRSSHQYYRYGYGYRYRYGYTYSRSHARKAA
ncbi:MAG: AAA family ATPase [Phycisphaera sp.]|nr:AAA family ATPase [Phycisphaera sp.]